MDTSRTLFRPGDHVADDPGILDVARFLAATAVPRSRTLTLTWLDHRRRLTGVAVPVRAVPERPSSDDAARFGAIIATVTRDHHPGGSVVAVLVRPGSDTVTDADRAWNRALRTQAHEHRFSLHGLFVAAAGTVRPVALDDAG